MADAVIDLWWIDTIREPDVAAAIRRILADRAELAPSQLEIVIGEGGKPAIRGRADLGFSVAHAPRYSVCAIGAGDIGVDCEPVRPRPGLDRVAMRLGLGRSASLRDIYLAWVFVEASGKTLGRGLDMPLIDLRPAHPGAVTRACVGDRAIAIVEVPAPDGYVAAVAAAAPGIAPRMRSFPEASAEGFRTVSIAGGRGR